MSSWKHTDITALSVMYGQMKVAQLLTSSKLLILANIILNAKGIHPFGCR
jgi:hypothetical protein